MTTRTLSYTEGSGAVACALAREGTKIFLAGRSREPLEAVAADIPVAGGSKYRKSVSGEDG